MQALSPKNGTPFRSLGPNAVPSSSSDGLEPFSASGNGLVYYVVQPSARVQTLPLTLLGVTRVLRGPSSRIKALAPRGIKPSDEHV